MLTRTLATIAVLSLAACGDNKPPTPPPTSMASLPPDGPYDTSKLTVPLCSTIQQVNHAIECAPPSPVDTALCVRADATLVVGCALVDESVRRLVTCVGPADCQ